MAAFIAVFFTVGSIQAQNTEPPPYNPCVTSPILPANCLDGSSTCDYFSQFPCTFGYCFDTGAIPDNAGIPPSGLVQNETFDIGGLYKITQNVRFVNCTFKMRNNARINISPLSNHAVVKISFENCDFFGCGDMWQGIVVDAAGIGTSLKFDFANCSVEDAYIGLTLDESSAGLPIGSSKLYYSIFNNIFRNNYIGVTNLRQSGNLNAVFVRNQFYQTANLATRLGHLANLVLPDYPLAHAGIKFKNVSAVVGVDQHGNQNTFSCLVNGIVTEGGTLESRNNFFFNLAENGIWSTEGRLSAIRCRFYERGRIGILANKVYLTAELNSFSGIWEEGIHSAENNSGEQILIRNVNSFNMTGDGWRTGVYVERPQSSSSFPSRIDGNTFITNSVGSTSTGITAIRVRDFVDATNEMIVSNNILNINATANVVNGIIAIAIEFGNSDRYNIHDNHLNFGTINKQGFGFHLFPVGSQNISMGHIVRHNDVTGISTANDQFFNPVVCCFHTRGIQGMDFCDNTVDQSSYGLHFLNSNNITLRNNQINNHSIGLEINTGDARIGKQKGRGNEWGLNPNACVLLAADVFNGNPFNSEFSVPEGNVLPWLPSNAKLFPDPSLSNWFHAGSEPLDYCVPMLSTQPLQLTPYEKEVVLGTSSLSGVALWDLKREVYSKLLIFPALRPTGSPEAAFFNSLNSNIIASLSNVIQQTRSGLGLTTAYQLAYDTYSAAIDLAFSNLEVFDGNMNYTSVLNLTETWFAQRDSLLQPIAVNAVAQAALVGTRNQQLSTALQNTLTYNAAIVTTQTYESAQKTIHELRIRRLLGLSITQALYQQALVLAQQGEGIVGKAAKDAIRYLAPCDQALFLNMEEGHQHSAQRNISSLASNTTILIVPNPTSGLTEVTLPYSTDGLLEVYSANGQKIKSFSIARGTDKVALDLSQKPSGFYWIRLLDETGKVIGTAKISVSH